MTEQNKPRLCIGVPVYNGEKFLAQAIESLLAQTFSDFRLVLSDNASTDGTADICRSYAACDRRIDYHRAAENRGGTWNFNHVVRLADVEYFKWAAHDDVCAPDFVRRCVEVLDRDPDVVLCYTKSRFIDEQGKVLGPYHCRVDATGATPFERFRNVTANLVLTHMEYGVARLEVLRSTRPMGSYPTADKILLAELALRGKLHEVDELLFSRRDHRDRGGRDEQTPGVVAAWFDPASRGHVRHLRWTRLFDHMRAVARTPMPLDQKLRCASFLLRLPLLRRWNPPRPSDANPWPV